MSNDELIEKIKEYEDISKLLDKDIKNMTSLMEEMKERKSLYKKLVEYYTSEEWLEHYDLSNETDTFKGIDHGVLSQDQIWNSMADLDEIAKEMIRLGVELLDI